MLLVQRSTLHEIGERFVHFFSGFFLHLFTAPHSFIGSCICMMCKCQTRIDRILFLPIYFLLSILFPLISSAPAGVTSLHVLSVLAFSLKNYLNSTFTTFSGSKLRWAHNLLIFDVFYNLHIRSLSHFLFVCVCWFFPKWMNDGMNGK